MSPLDTLMLALDVEASDGRVLARAGEPVGQAARTAADRAREAGRRPVRALKDTPLRDHLAEVAREPLYQTVFADRRGLAAGLALLGEVAVPAPLLEEFERMRRLDAYTYRHVLMTTVLTTRMLQDLGAEPGEVARGAFAALTHDVGKMRVPLGILQKETPLTPEELATLRQHPAVGCVLLHYYLGQDGVNARVARAHHERPDGSGYPCGIALADHLVRLVAANDIFDALVSPRPYRQEAFTVRGALEFLWGEVKAGRVDEMAVRLLVSYNRRDKPDPRTLAVSEEIRAAPPAGNRYGCVWPEPEGGGREVGG
ncbi:MAG: hypothetical protein Kow0092_17650 [Deferrisomatales bacterium]